MLDLLPNLAQACGVLIVTIALVAAVGWLGLVPLGAALVWAGERWSK